MITVSNPCVVGTDKQVVGFLMIMLPATQVRARLTTRLPNWASDDNRGLGVVL